jgi:GT2 family glycosyltransferase
VLESLSLDVRRATEAGRADDVSVIVVTHNEGNSLLRTVTRLRETAPTSSEMIVVDDFSTDGSVERLRAEHSDVCVVRPPTRFGPTLARNFGARFATRPVLVWSDAHVDPEPGWFPAFASLLADRRVGAVGPAVVTMGEAEKVGFGMRWKSPSLDVEWLPRQGNEPYPVPLLGGFFMAMQREVFEGLSGFDAGLIHWGGGDVELSFRLWTLGYECWVVPTARVAHLFRNRFPYAVEPFELLHNLLRIAIVHFDHERLTLVLTALRERPLFAKALATLIESQVLERRAEVQSLRVISNTDFFTRFQMPGLSPESAGEPRSA